jgi:hypothetical protein
LNSFEELAPFGTIGRNSLSSVAHRTWRVVAVVRAFVDVPAYFEMKVSVPEFEAMLRRQFDTLYREGETISRVMAIAVHPFVTGQPHRIGALDAALEYICSHAGVWQATGWEIVHHFLGEHE